MERGWPVHHGDRWLVHADGWLQRCGTHPTLDATKNLVRTGQLRFFLLVPEIGVLGNGPGPSGMASSIAAWVRSTCAMVAPSVYGGTDQSTAQALPGDFGAGGSSVYRCDSA